MILHFSMQVELPFKVNASYIQVKILICSCIYLSKNLQFSACNIAIQTPLPDSTAMYLTLCQGCQDPTSPWLRKLQ